MRRLELSGPDTYLSLLGKAVDKDIKAIGEVVSGSFGDVPATYRIMLREAGLAAVRSASIVQLRVLADSLLHRAGDDYTCAWKRPEAVESQVAMKAEERLVADDLERFYRKVQAADTKARAKLQQARDACGDVPANGDASQCATLRAALESSLSVAYSRAFRHTGWAKGSPKADALLASPCPLLGKAGDPKAEFSAKSDALVPSATKATKDATQTIFDMVFPSVGISMKLAKSAATDVPKLIALGSGSSSIFSTWSISLKSYIGSGFAIAGISLSITKNMMEYRQKKSSLYTTR